ncbi:unnamed protein product, partial [Aureobasidium uvarum]
MASNSNGHSWKCAVDALRQYYAFLANDLGAIPSTCIVEPPVEGWPTITQTSLAGLEKTDTVIEFLRHLPYIESSGEYNTQIGFSTCAVDYRAYGKYMVAKGERSRFYPVGSEDFPPNVVVLTEEGEDYYGSLLLVDVEKGCDYISAQHSLSDSDLVGTATDYQPRGARKAGVPDPSTTPQIWRYSETKPIAELLASWEQKFRSLEWTVNPFNDEGGMMLRHDRATDVYRDHGWPDDFRRKECRDALRGWNRTINDRLSQPGNNLLEITRQPPGLRK